MGSDGLDEDDREEGVRSDRDRVCVDGEMAKSSQVIEIFGGTKMRYPPWRARQRGTFFWCQREASSGQGALMDLCQIFV